MGVLRGLMIAMAAAALLQTAMGANFIVGGASNGWDLRTNFQAWASSQSFTVGDTITFTYSSIHSVLEVSKADHDSCQTSNPISSYSSGNDVIKLGSAGKRYFICGAIGHCSAGMNVEIDTISAATTPPPSPPPSPRLAPPPITASHPPPAKSPPPKPRSPPSTAPKIAPLSSPPSSAISPSPKPSSAPSTPPLAQVPSGPRPSAAHHCSLRMMVVEGLLTGVLIALTL